MGQEGFDVDAAHAVINVGNQAVIVSTNVKNGQVMGDIGAAKGFSEFVKVAELCGANVNDPVGQWCAGVRVSGHRLFEAFFGDDPHEDRLGQNSLKCNPSILEFLNCARAGILLRRDLACVGIEGHFLRVDFPHHSFGMCQDALVLISSRAERVGTEGDAT